MERDVRLQFAFVDPDKDSQESLYLTEFVTDFTEDEEKIIGLTSEYKKLAESLSPIVDSNNVDDDINSLEALLSKLPPVPNSWRPKFLDRGPLEDSEKISFKNVIEKLAISYIHLDYLHDNKLTNRALSKKTMQKINNVLYKVRHAESTVDASNYLKDTEIKAFTLNLDEKIKKSSLFALEDIVKDIRTLQTKINQQNDFVGSPLRRDSGGQSRSTEGNHTNFQNRINAAQPTPPQSPRTSRR